MVKADLSRDYYGDLEIAPTADVAEIKKQFKKLALTYHPDRNPGRESEVTAKFQRIQSAHEVLIDASERAKYDANRSRSSAAYRSYGGGQPSGMRGNPWSNVSSQYPPPPKPPTARSRQQPPPRPSGADRYAKFGAAAPNTSANQAAQDIPGSRQRTYEAWENIRHPNRTETGPGKTWQSPQVPPRGTPKSGQEESNSRSRRKPPPPTPPRFDEYREPNGENSSHSRSQSRNASSRKGFMPNDPSGDEPPAPMGAYSTQRNKPNAPPPPPREPPISNGIPDPLKGFREERSYDRPRQDPSNSFREELHTTEPRISTPYATHGGEKLNPFESANINRSKSTRERGDRFNNDSVPRTNSSAKLNTPHRARSFAEHPRSAKYATAESFNLSSSSSDEMPEFVLKRPSARANGIPQSQKPASTPIDPNIIQNGNTPQPSAPNINGNGEPSMYAKPTSSFVSDAQRQYKTDRKLSTVSEKSPLNGTSLNSGTQAGHFDIHNRDENPFLSPPSRGTARPTNLNTFEEAQRTIVNQLLSNKRSASFGTPNTPGESQSFDSALPSYKSTPNVRCDPWTTYGDKDSNGYSTVGSPTKKRKDSKLSEASRLVDSLWSRPVWAGISKSTCNKANLSVHPSSFSFNIEQDTFTTTHPRKSFSKSTENISTKFTPEDWDGKFEAGADYFKPNEKTTPVRSRTQSSSRTRGRSPIKVKPVDPKTMPPPPEQTPVESPGGTKFSAEAWAQTFNRDNFMPNLGATPRATPSRKRTGPSLRPTMGGNAAVLDESDTSDEKSLFTGPKDSFVQASPGNVSPDPMDVDTPPVSHTAPPFTTKLNEKLSATAEQSKRPAVASPSPSPDTADLKAGFDNLRVKDIMTSLSIPAPPDAPVLPEIPAGQPAPTRQEFDAYTVRFGKYMNEWDLFDSKFLLHMLARKNQNDQLGPKRWLGDNSQTVYRNGLTEDLTVLEVWRKYKERHEEIFKNFTIMEYRVAEQEAKDRSGRPRKKTH